MLGVPAGYTRDILVPLAQNLRLRVFCWRTEAEGSSLVELSMQRRAQMPVWQHDRSMARLLSLLVLCCSTGVPAFAQSSAKDTIHSLVASFSQWNGQSSDRAVLGNAAKYIDYRTMAERALSQAKWEKLTTTQQDRFIGSLKTLIERRYYRRWHKLFGKYKLNYVGELTAGQDILVKTSLTLGKKADLITWRLDTSHGDLKVVSLATGDKDLLSRLSVRLQARYNKYGFDKLLAWMQRKADTDDQGDSSR